MKEKIILETKRICVGLLVLFSLMFIISTIGFYLDLTYPLMSNLLRSVMLIITSYYIGRNLVK